MPIGTRYTLLQDMTPADALRDRRSLVVWCEPCRVGRTISVSALAQFRPTQPIRLIKFRCRVCNKLGTPSADGHADGYRINFYPSRPAWVKDEDWRP